MSCNLSVLNSVMTTWNSPYHTQISFHCNQGRISNTYFVLMLFSLIIFISRLFFLGNENVH